MIRVEFVYSWPVQTVTPNAPTGDSDEPSPRPPSWLLTILEVPRALSEASVLIPARSLLRGLPPGDGHAVMTLPGFLASDRSMRTVRSYLQTWGYKAYPWELGRNLGPSRHRDIEHLLDTRLLQIAEESGEKVSLVGWSLGGLLARELARRNPRLVRSVITLGSPIGDPRATNAWRLFEAVSGMSIDEAQIRERIRQLRKPLRGIPMTAIYSRSDAVVSADIARMPPGKLVESIGIVASHFGMGFNPAVLFAISDRLRQHPRDWQPFEISGLRNLFYH